MIEALKAEPPLPDIVEGSAEAPATIIEYASMTCSHCAAFHREVWPELKAKYVDRGKAKFILKEFPLDPLSIAAFMLAHAPAPRSAPRLSTASSTSRPTGPSPRRRFTS